MIINVTIGRQSETCINALIAECEAKADMFEKLARDHNCIGALGPHIDMWRRRATEARIALQAKQDNSFLLR